ncbi:hypothetical protein LR48_Vigan09g151000 [Vigna angularis]|uniref:Uncharacterized protein n=1 Tax=Phaseolus angularis TaxID=3914 RepID=A0A0L9VCQ8_PHAAN|nr:hypothetical protein LR48_Vigan09g151000 [Vigna angularis]
MGASWRPPPFVTVPDSLSVHAIPAGNRLSSTTKQPRIPPLPASMLTAGVITSRSSGQQQGWLKVTVIGPWRLDDERMVSLWVMV